MQETTKTFASLFNVALLIAALAFVVIGQVSAGPDDDCSVEVCGGGPDLCCIEGGTIFFTETAIEQ